MIGLMIGMWLGVWIGGYSMFRLLGYSNHEFWCGRDE